MCSRACAPGVAARPLTTGGTVSARWADAPPSRFSLIVHALQPHPLVLLLAGAALLLRVFLSAQLARVARQAAAAAERAGCMHALARAAAATLAARGSRPQGARSASSGCDLHCESR